MVYFCGYELSNDCGQKWNFSSQKRSKFQILSYRSVIYLKRKLRTYTIKIQPEKVRFLAKKYIFFRFFDFLPNARGPPKIFDAQFSNTFKTNSKNGLSGMCLVPKGTKSWILVSLALYLGKRQTVFGHPGHNGPPSCRIGLKWSWTSGYCSEWVNVQSWQETYIPLD